MEIPVKNLSRRKEVKVNIKPADAVDELPTPPAEYRVGGNVDEDLLRELAEEFVDDDCCPNSNFGYCDLDDETYSKKNLAEQLALLSPKEAMKIYRASKYLRKFNKAVKEDYDGEDD